MIYYKVFHFFITKQKEHFHFFNIGIYDSLKNANDAIEKLLKTIRIANATATNLLVFTMREFLLIILPCRFRKGLSGCANSAQTI